MPSIRVIIAISVCNKLNIWREHFFCVNNWHHRTGKKPELNFCDVFFHAGSLDYCGFFLNFTGY